MKLHFVILVVTVLQTCEAFVASQNSCLRRSSSKPTMLVLCESNGFFQAVGDFFKELDNFMDDASARRLGNGAAFYGKRKSNFYGENDKFKKTDPDRADPTEDYQVTAGGYFKWMPDEDGELRPVTRLKNQLMEQPEGYWERIYEKEEQEK